MRRLRSSTCQRCGGHLAFYWIETGNPPNVHIDATKILEAKRRHRC